MSSTSDPATEPDHFPASAEDRYRDLFENVPDGVYETTVDGRILSANPALVRMLGFESEDELKRDFFAQSLYVDPVRRQDVVEALRTEGALHNLELELRRKDGQVITVLENSRAVTSEDGQRLYYQGTLTDITGWKAARAELSRTRDQALEASRLKSRILANVSHELRTPLNAVVAMSQLLGETKLDQTQREYVRAIRTSGAFLLELISELLDYSRIEAGRLELEPSAFRLRDVAEESAVMLAERANVKALELVCDISPALPEVVFADPGRLRQVLMNLVGNGVKFTERGEVCLRVLPDPEQPEFVRFEVSDTGIGIAPEARYRIFEPFNQADPSAARRYGGAGLGLSIARQIVEKMGGRLEFESTPGEGTLFWFSIRLEAAPGSWHAPAPLDRGWGGKRCGVISPNAAVRTVISSWVERWGMLALAAAHIPEISPDPPCDLVLLDRRALMDDRPPPCAMSGAPVVLITASGHRGDVPRWVTGKVLKPIREMSLLQAASQAMTPNARRMEPAARTRFPAPRRIARILAAEDNPINQVVIRKLVQRLGHSIEIVPSGEEVVAAAGSREYDLILMDCQMPGMDGFAATAAIRKLPGAAARVPIIAVTAHAIKGDREICLASGMNDYLAKPILMEDLAGILAQWIDRTP